MNAGFFVIIVFLPILGGALIPFLPFKNRTQLMIYTEGLVLLNAAIAIAVLLNQPEESFVLFHFTSNITLTFHLDGLGTVFAGLISVLWPLATLYAFEYMKHEENEKIFFMFYVITFGITMGIALSENVVTMYCFYEMLTLVTVPLVIHTLTREAVLATRTYLYYSLGGAGFAFIGVVFLLVHGTTPSFVAGGVLDADSVETYRNLLLFIYVLCFCGFSVKAAMFPFSGWLPKAGVAPTPVTALLHAVAVVKAGAFTILRITYYSFGTDFLRGSWAQTVVLIPIIITIVYGCSRGLKETHFKRRLAWSTVSNLSYILFGAALMSPLGLIGALSHMIFHAVMKIAAFFCAGAVIYKSGREYVPQLDGLGRKMPHVFVIFTISGLALMGVPGLCGFISKWNLVKAAVESENPVAYVGIAALLISALLTALYMLTISVRAFLSKPYVVAAAQHSTAPTAAGQDGTAAPTAAAAAQTAVTAQTCAESPTAETRNATAAAQPCDEPKAAPNAAAHGHGLTPYDEVNDPNWFMLLPLYLFVAAMVIFGLHPQPLLDAFAKIAAAMN